MVSFSLEWNISSITNISEPPTTNTANKMNNVVIDIVVIDIVAMDSDKKKL